jgi:hypothetical protein
MYKLKVLLQNKEKVNEVSKRYTKERKELNKRLNNNRNDSKEWNKLKDIIYGKEYII